MIGEWHNVDLAWLLITPLVVASISWTWTKEKIFSDIQEWIVARRDHSRFWWQRKIATGLSCEYCFSHWVTAVCLFILDWRLLLPDWRGCVLSFFSIVCIANVYMSLYNLLRVDLRANKAVASKMDVK
jgi:hypothetical protein